MIFFYFIRRKNSVYFLLPSFLLYAKALRIKLKAYLTEENKWRAYSIIAIKDTCSFLVKGDDLSIS